MRKKSKYKPKPIIQNTVLWVLAGMVPVNVAKEAMLDLRIKNHGALAALQQGKADAHDIDRLASAVNMALALMALGGPELGIDYEAEFHAAANAVYEIAVRGGNYIAHANELNAINFGMDLHEAQLDKTTVRLFERALEMERQARLTGSGRRITLEGIYA